MTSVIELYLDIFTSSTEKYGKRTVLLYQIGDFFEVYSLRDPTRHDHTIIQEFGRVCDLAVVPKNSTHPVLKLPIMMAGFKIDRLDRYLPRLNKAGLTSVVYVQSSADKTVRVLSEVCTTGIYFDVNTDRLTNCVMGVWLELNGSPPSLTIGVSVINVFTGKSIITELSPGRYIDRLQTYDDLERIYQVYQPQEMLIIADSGVVTSTIEGLIDRSRSTCVTITPSDDESVKVYTKQTFQLEIFNRIFDVPDYVHLFQSNLINTHPVTMQSYARLLDYIQQRNPTLIKHIPPPELDTAAKTHLQLSNHSLTQLNIVGEGGVCDVVNKCCTAMGRRQLNHLLTHPITDPTILQQSYDAIRTTLDDVPFEDIRKILHHVGDLEKLFRKIVLGRSSSMDLVGLARDLTNSVNAINLLSSDAASAHSIAAIATDLASQITHKLTSKGVFKPSCCRALREACDQQNSARAIITSVEEYLTQIKLPVKVVESSLSHDIEVQITATRYKKLLECTVTHDALKDLSSYSKNKSSITLTSPSLAKAYTLYKASYVRISTITEKLLKRLSSLIESKKEELMCVIEYITNLDVLCTKAYIAREYNYCQPTIIPATPTPPTQSSRIEAVGLRHAIIERLPTAEIYVPNDLEIGEQGILLYGTNAVGKSSLIRSVGIAVVLAQAGMYVPASSFAFRPYTAIYTRILGNDDLFRGMSTFAVEMSELRTILTNANSTSLVLGDEICSGTESSSAISIFVAGVESLCERGATFLFATHFHEIVNFEEIQTLTNPSLPHSHPATHPRPHQHLRLMHMSVVYDAEKGCLVYNRKLQEGPGASTYGLEVCRSLSLPQSFLTRASELRVKYYPTGSYELGESRYNTKKIKGVCEMCNHPSSDVHHLQYQSSATTTTKHISHFHMNHPGNLASVCKECHDLIHEQNLKLVRKKTTKGYIFETTN